MVPLPRSQRKQMQGLIASGTILSVFDFKYNPPVDAGVLADFFKRNGWRESEPGLKMEWAIAFSDDWVTCSMEGELVGFGRACSLGSGRKMLFDVIVDERFWGQGLDEEIIRLLAEGSYGTEEVAVFRPEDPAASGNEVGLLGIAGRLPEAPLGTYLG